MRVAGDHRRCPKGRLRLVSLPQALERTVWETARLRISVTSVIESTQRTDSAEFSFLCLLDDMTGRLLELSVPRVTRRFTTVGLKDMLLTLLSTTDSDPHWNGNP